MSRTLKPSVAILLLISVLFTAWPAFACGPFSTDAIFTFTVHPEPPLEKFARGQAGLLQPTYARSYLVVAYRELAGKGLDQQEQKAAAEFWKSRLEYSWSPEYEDEIKAWQDARKKVLPEGQPPKIDAYRQRAKPNEYDRYLNCHKDAFQTAVATLNERSKTYGAASNELKAWVRAQDQVFANCSEGRQIPDAAPAGAGELARADRAYQIAAANFYSENFDEARKGFESVAGDARSPWRSSAHYLVARTLIRKASLGPAESHKESLTQAEGQLRKVIGDASLSAMHAAATRLLNLVRLRLHPEERVRELAQSLLQNSGEHFKQDLWDYTDLLDRFLGESDSQEKKGMPPLPREDELTDWVITFQAKGTEARDHALQKWQKTSSLPWLVAALTKADAGTAKLSSLLEAAGKVKPDSPAFASVSFQTVRLLAESGRGDEARTKLDELLSKHRSALTTSALNLLLGQRMRLATNLFEFLKFAQRTPAAFSVGDDGREIPEDISNDENGKELRDRQILFDVDGAKVLNQKLPLALLKQAALSDALPPLLRRDLAQAIWIRAVVLEDVDTAREVAPALKSLAPDMGTFLDEYVAARAPDARRFSAIYTWLKFPGIEPVVDAGVGRTTPLGKQDVYRDNWWCAASVTPKEPGETGETEEAKTAPAFTTSADAPPPPFLDAAQKSAAEKEYARLTSFGAAPNYLARQVIAWAEKNPADPRVPEALHLVVKSTRYGCTDKDSARWSKAAFDLLHKRYPTSPWAKRTPYWFKD